MTNWCVYLLWNPRTKKTYIGSTTDYWRRVSQHNRLRKGGARSTEKGAPDWCLSAVLEGFKTRSDACRWEAILKKRARGHKDRFGAFWAVSMGVCPSYKNRPKYEVPIGLSFQTWGEENVSL